MSRKLLIFVVIIGALFYLTADNINQYLLGGQNNTVLTLPEDLLKKIPGLNKDRESFKDTIPIIVIDHDQDGDGVADLADILEGARQDARNKPTYQSTYYAGGYPPDDEGVCTDVIWRAFKNAGYNLKDLMDEDIKNNVEAYPRVDGSPEPNIDFRRVPNLVSFFERHATVLTTDLIPYDLENLTHWQGGDIVVFGKPLKHIGIVSDIRGEDGVPYMVHNGGPYTKEEDAIIYWHKNISKIIGHYRWPQVE